MVVLPASGAFAHNCFVIDRNVNFVGERGGWFGVEVDPFIDFEVGLGLYTAAEGECVKAKFPDKIAIKVQGANGNEGVLLHNNPNNATLASNLHGAETIDAIYLSCGVVVPPQD